MWVTEGLSGVIPKRWRPRCAFGTGKLTFPQQRLISINGAERPAGRNVDAGAAEVAMWS